MRLDDYPLISVIMGVRFRRAETDLLERAISSILGQSWSNFEFLICEDGSSETARNLLSEFAAQDSRIRLIDGAGAWSLAAKLNRCICAARGAWIARQDDDDFSYSERLTAQMEHLYSHPEYGFVGCSVDLEKDGVRVGCRQLPEHPQISDFFLVQPYIHPTLIFRRSVLEAVGGYCEAVRCNGCEDYDLLIRLHQAGFPGANLPTPYFSYTLPASGTHTRTFRMRLHEVETRFVRFRSLGLFPGALPYVIKPVLVGLIPDKLLNHLKKKYIMK